MSTFPVSDYDLEETLTSAGIGEAVITVMNEKGAPTPVALTKLRAPESVMGPSTDELIGSTIAASPLLPKYGTAVDNISAYEKLSGKGDRTRHRRGRARSSLRYLPPLTTMPWTPKPAGSRKRSLAVPAAVPLPGSTPEEWPPAPAHAPAPAPQQDGGGMMGDLAGVLGGALGGGIKSMARSLGTQLGRELLRGVFGTSSRRRR